MAKIIDPDDLTYELALVASGTDNIVVDTAAKLIEINTGVSLSDDGLSGQALYSKLKEIWKLEPLAIPYDFPMEAITPEQFEFREGWELSDVNSVNLIRDAGFAYRPVGGGAATALYMGFDSVFSLHDDAQSAGDQIYMELDEPNGTKIDTYITGQANEPVQIYGDASHGDFDYTSNDLRFFCREQGKDFAFSSVTALNVATPLTYKKYAFPMSNSLDVTIDGVGGLQDSDIVTTAFPDAPDKTPFSLMSIDSDGAPNARTIGGVSYNFDIIIDGADATAEQIYAFIQYQIRRAAVDIDVGTEILNGATADELLTFVGTTLHTIQDRNGRGVFIDNFNANDTNRIYFVDNTGAERKFPFVAAGSINFNANLVSDTVARYWMFFENDDAGDNSGFDFFTDDAILVHGNTKVESGSGADITFTANHILSGPLDLSVFSDGDVVHIEGSTSNDGYYTVSGAPTAGDITVVETLNVEDGLAATDCSVTITGLADTASIGFDFDYDGNLQRGTGSDGTDAPIVVVALGLDTGQYVRTPTIAEGGSYTIGEAVGQVISLTAALERNYSNP